MEIINTVTSVAALIIVLFGIQFGKKMLFKNETIFGKEADDRYKSIKDKLPNDSIFYGGIYEGGNKITPQFEIERFHYDPQTMMNIPAQKTQVSDETDPGVR
ncbi:hypothetical protein LQZ19_07565 [Treponema primitia]|uniref:hypothetical protein n=1 Tax=Treponema primitia TaxID=88058 RepID=UPI00397EFC1C